MSAVTMNAEEATAKRKRRWKFLKEDGELFGLTDDEGAELARLEEEFGPQKNQFRATKDGAR